MAQTIFERLTRGPVPVEYRHYNPLLAKLGSIFTLDVLGHRGRTYVLSEIWAYQRTIDGKPAPFADYVLMHHEATIRLRVLPVERPDGVTPYQVLLLERRDQMPYCKELDDACRCGSGELDITTDGMTEKFWRPAVDESGSRRLTMPYVATISVLIAGAEVTISRVEYWDYSRITNDEAGQEFTQHLFVEVDRDSWMQTLWVGEEVDAQRVAVL